MCKVLHTGANETLRLSVIVLALTSNAPVQTLKSGSCEVLRNVKAMSKQVDEILREECSSFEDRQEVICSLAGQVSLKLRWEAA